MRTTNPPRRLAAAAGLAFCLAATPALAQEWALSGSGLWNDPANWSPMSVPDGVGAQAFFASTIQGGPISQLTGVWFDADVTLGHLSIDMGIGGAGFTILDSVLTLDNGGGADVTIFTTGTSNVEITGQIVLMGDLVTDWRADNGRISASISGDHAVIIDSPQPGRRIRLWGANTHTGGTIVRNGRLSIQSAANLGDPAAGTIVEGVSVLIIESGASPTINGHPVTLMDGGRMHAQSGDWAETITLVGSGEIAPWFDGLEFTVSGQITGDAVFVRGSAQSNVTSNPTVESILTLTNTANDYTGGTIIRSGVLSFATDAALGAPGTPITFHTMGFSEGPPAIATTANTTIVRDIAMTTDGGLRADPGTVATYTGVISGARNLAIGFEQWTGGVNLASANTYTLGTHVQAGTLIVTNTTGSATGAGAVTLEPGTALAGDGAISGAVTVADTALVAPGMSTGTLSVGAISFAPDSLLDIELDGADPGQFDRIQVAGAAALDGHLTVAYIDGYFPNVNDEFEIISAASVTGVFATTDLPDGFEIDYFADRVVLRAANVTPPCPADLSADGVVDGTDLGALLLAWGACPAPCAADLSGDGVVDGTDLGALLLAWGACP